MQLVLRRVRSLAAMAVASVLVACGGGGGSTGSETLQAAAAPSAKGLVYSVESREQPASAVQDVARLKERAVRQPITPSRIALGPLDQSKDAAADSGGIGPRQVGTPRSVSQTATASATVQQLQWTPTANGGQLAAMSFSADGAHGIRLGVLVRKLPGSAVLRVYSQAKPSAVFEIAGQEVLQILERNQAAGDTSDAGRTWWTPDTGGDEATLEIELPAGTPASALDLSVPRLSHIYANLSLPTADEFEQTKINESDACNLDSTCYNDYASQRNAVARMLFVLEDGKAYLCTGTLLNDRDGTGTPYFISANHCISTQTVASTLRTDWFYRSPSCNSRTLSSSTTARTGGATLLYATSNTDTSFLRLNEAPPAGAVFAAWNANPQAVGGALVGIHHPEGDLQKISFGNLASLSTCTSLGGISFTCSGTSGNFYRVTWSQGTVEGGSSGSGIFSGGALVGTLYGGSAVCTNKASSDFYGRFDVAYNASLKDWLSPATSTSGRTAVYRFFNSSTGAHFFTASAGERDFVISTYPAFAYEGVAFYAYGGPTAGQNAVYRFFNKSNGAHFYTIDAGERDFVRATYPSFEYEGPIWYAQTGAGNGATAMYRFFNKSNGTHFYTISQGERDFVQATYPVYQYEGPVYYAWTAN